MKIYVDEMPNSCDECDLCQHGHLKFFRNGRYIEAKGCVLGSFYKYRTIDDEVDTCPLQQLQKVNDSCEKSTESYQNMWEKLKEILKYNELLKIKHIRPVDILEKMQELEKE